MGRTVQEKQELNRAREQFNDNVADIFARLHKDQKVFYVGATNGNAAFSGRKVTSQKASLGGANGALALMTAGRGDTVLIDPFHTETVTASLVPVASSVVKGLNVGNLRPVLTVNGAIDLFSLSAANVDLSNLELNIATTDAATALIDVSAAKCKISNIKMIPSAAGNLNVVDCITLAAGADDTIIDGVNIFNTLTAVNSFISIEAAVARCVIKNSHMSGDLVTAGIIDAATATQLRILNNIIKTIGTNIPACILDSNPTGEAIGNYMLGTDATIANNAQWGSALILANNYTRGGTGSTVSATNIIPALDT